MLVKGRVFISHAHEDNARCRPLLDALTVWGVPYWFDTEQVTGGTELALKIQRAIEESQYFIRVCTLSSVSSFWVRKETGAFVSLQAEDFRRGIEDRVLIPVILDAGYSLQLEDRGVVQIRAAGVAEATWLDELRRALGVPATGGGPLRERPNFFLLLDLDPDAPWSDEVYERNSRAKLNKWVAMTNSVGPTKYEGFKNLRLVGEIRHVMEDPSLRAREAAEAREEQSKIAAQQLHDLDQELAIIQAKGYVQRAEIDDLVKRYAPTVSEREVRARITVPIRGETRSEPLVPVVARDIRNGLDFLGEESLYSLLEHAVDSSISIRTASSALIDAADRLNAWTMAQANISQDTITKRRLAGHARDIFSNEEKRARYDETLRREPLNKLLATYERSCAASAAISSEQVRMFLGEARRLGFDDEFAYEQLRALAERRHWSIAPRP